MGFLVAMGLRLDTLVQATSDDTLVNPNIDTNPQSNTEAERNSHLGSFSVEKSDAPCERIQWCCCAVTSQSAGTEAEIVPTNIEDLFDARDDKMWQTRLDVLALSSSFERHHSPLLDDGPQLEPKPLSAELWLQDCALGKLIDLLMPCPLPVDKPISCSQMAESWFFLNCARTKLTFRIVDVDAPGVDVDAPTTIVIHVKKITVIAAATDYTYLFAQKSQLFKNTELDRAVLLQFLAEDDERMHVCFLAETVTAQALFIKSLTHLRLATHFPVLG